MKKVTKLLSVFLIAGVLGTGAAAGVVGCTPKNDDKDDHTHTAGNTWEGDDTNHWHLCTANDGEQMDKGEHKDDDKNGKCDTCDRAMSGSQQGLVVPAGVNGIILEGITGGTVTLSTTKTSHDIDKNAITAYFATGATKGDAIPKANIELKLYKNAAEEITTWTGLKEDADYVVVATLINAKTAAGAAAELEGEVTVKVSNPIATIALKSGTVEFKQGTTASTTDWVFEGTRANGDKEALTGVTVGKIDTVNAGDQNVTISYNGINGTVKCTITADETMVTQSYAINVNTLADEVINANKPIDTTSGVSVVATSSKAVTIESKDVLTSGTKAFNKRLKLAGDANAVVIPNVNEAVAGATANTTVKTKVTIYAISGNSTNKRFISFTKDEETTPNVEQAVLLDGGEITKCEFMLTEPGTYKFATFKSDKFTGHPDLAQAGSNGGINLYYIQVDKMISNAPEGLQNIPLGGEAELIDLELNTSNVKTLYAKDEAFSSVGLTATASYANEVTAEFSSRELTTADLTIGAVDTSTYGSKEVTVTYNGETAKFNAYVAIIDDVYELTAENIEEMIAEGSSSLTINLKDKITAGLAIKEAKSEGVKNTFAIKSITNKADSSNVDLTTSSNLSAATYNYSVVVTINGETTGSADVTLDVTVVVKAFTNTAEFVVDSQTASGTKAIEDNAMFTATSGSDTSLLDISAKENKRPLYGEERMNTLLRIAKVTKNGGSSDILTLTAKQDCTITAYIDASDNGFGSDRKSDTSKITTKIGSAAAVEVYGSTTTAVLGRDKLMAITVTLKAGETCTVNYTNGNGSDAYIQLAAIVAEVAKNA